MLVFPACRNSAAPPSGGRIAFMTALPLFGTTSDPDTLLNGPDQRAAIVRAISSRYKVVALARIEPKWLEGAILILAQPRGLAREELVAIDAWVRAGGRALVFTDPELVWPSALPLGDPRRAPPIGLLDPLLSHWGLTMVSPAVTDAGPERTIKVGQSAVAVAWAGRWQTRNPGCTIESEGLIVDCRIEKGRVLLVADADLLDERLWQSSGTDNESAILELISRVAAVR
jgi:hypothetical protein